MISCTAPAATTSLSGTQPWNTMLHQQHIKEEIQENENPSDYSKEQCGSFFSEGFHSASPSSSSKDSNAALSPRSVGSNAGDTSPTFYDSMPLQTKLGVHLEAYRNEYPYSLLTPPDCQQRSPGYEHIYSPRLMTGARSHDTNLAPSPPKSPRLTSPDLVDRRNDSGYQHSPAPVKTEPTDDDAMRDISDSEDDGEEPGVKIPAVNSHGKVKTFKCKQCEYVAVTKLTFWEHTKEHIKPEKMLKCQKCPFVTEYKHHLEYHMRNHFGSKPFRCPSCNYSCVNKSMLNSHLKSHSNIYQYRCSDCNYATKYCHSLKLHLRKYQHSPAMVLNQDGTPNPLPIIDVYGTRRGPKQKSSRHHDAHQQTTTTSIMSAAKTQAPPGFLSHPFGVNFPYSGLIPPPFLLHNGVEKYPEHDDRSMKSPLGIAPLCEQTLTETHSPIIEREKRERSLETDDNTVTTPLSSPGERVLRSPRTPPPSAGTNALDLSRRDSPSPAECSTPITPNASSKNRRKGRAFKLEPEALRLQHTEPATSVTETACKVPESATSFECTHCDIVFRDLTMHMIHMGFHGYNDPFMCNKCGERSSDRISFFIHLGRAQHS